MIIVHNFNSEIDCFNQFIVQESPLKLFHLDLLHEFTKPYRTVAYEWIYLIYSLYLLLIYSMALTWKILTYEVDWLLLALTTGPNILRSLRPLESPQGNQHREIAVPWRQFPGCWLVKTLIWRHGTIFWLVQKICYWPLHSKKFWILLVFWKTSVYFKKPHWYFTQNFGIL